MSEKRLEALRRMALARPQDPRAHFGLAVELLNAGALREGSEALRRYLSLAEDEGNGWGRLGAALAELGEVDEAREAFRRGIAVAERRGHGGLAEELQESLDDLT